MQLSRVRVLRRYPPDYPPASLDRGACVSIRGDFTGREQAMATATYVDEFVQHYIVCALWSSTVDDAGTPMDQDYSADDLAPETLNKIREECLDFCAAQTTLLDEAEREYGRGAESCGHDFWLTRNGHGAGFWDRGMGRLGRQLTDASKPYGSADLYVGDDGKIYQM